MGDEVAIGPVADEDRAETVGRRAGARAGVNLGDQRPVRDVDHEEHGALVVAVVAVAEDGAEHVVFQGHDLHVRDASAEVRVRELPQDVAGVHVLRVGDVEGKDRATADTHGANDHGPPRPADQDIRYCRRAVYRIAVVIGHGGELRKGRKVLTRHGLEELAGHVAEQLFPRLGIEAMEYAAVARYQQEFGARRGGRLAGDVGRVEARREIRAQQLETRAAVGHELRCTTDDVADKAQVTGART